MIFQIITDEYFECTSKMESTHSTHTATGKKSSKKQPL